MYKTPSRRRQKKVEEKLNLAPILDAIFIFIFFLLMNIQLLNIYEISSDIPMTSDEPPPKDKKIPLQLRLVVQEDVISVYTGFPKSKIVQEFKKAADGKYEFDALHTFLVTLKKANLDERMALIEPVGDVTYEDLVKIMDNTRMFKKTDETLFKTNAQGVNEEIPQLFDNIVLNTQS